MTASRYTFEANRVSIRTITLSTYCSSLCGAAAIAAIPVRIWQLFVSARAKQSAPANHSDRPITSFMISFVPP